MISSLRTSTLRCRSSRPMLAGTGTHCPASGWWSPDGDPRNGQQFFEGSLMPTFKGKPVVWALDPDSDRR
ncbi:hypothetical protein [Arthrobacter sp. C152]